MPGVTDLKIATWFGFRPPHPVSLHVFCDVSEKSYDCCVYAVSEARVELLLAKSKVAPVSPPTLACLELSCAICFERVSCSSQ